MPDARTCLIEAAVRPFSDNAEMKAAATHLLGELVKADPPDAEGAIRQWDAVDSRPRGTIWKSALWILLVVVSIGVGVRDFREISRYVVWRGWVGGSMGQFMPSPDPAFARGLTAGQKLLLLGSEAEENRTKRTEALWRSEPENRGYFSEHALASIHDSNTLPPDFTLTARRMDPDNAWFTYLAAAIEAKGAVRQEIDTSGKTTWMILDQPRLDRALDLLREARTQPEFENYSAKMMSARLALLPTPNRITRMDTVRVLAGQISAPMLQMMQVASLINSQAWLAAETGDVEAFREISLDAEHFLKGVARSKAGTLLEGVVTTAFVPVMAKQFESSAETLGLQEAASRWKRIYERIVATRRLTRSTPFTIEGREADPQLVSGTLFGSVFPERGMTLLEHPPQPTDDDVRPGRLLDHEILSRFCSYASWIVMGLCLAAVAVYRFRVSRLFRRLSGRMEELLDGRDWGWILGAGILLPLSYVLVVNRLTPLGGREFGMIGNGMLLPAGHFVGLILLWLTFPSLVTRWRLAKRAGGLGFAGAGWLGWIAVACAAAFVPLIGWAASSQSYAPDWRFWMEDLGIDLPESPGEPWRFGVALGFLGVPLLWVIFCTFRALLSPMQRVIHHATVARVLVRVFMMAMLLLAILTIGFKAAENHWFQRETLGRVDPATPGWSAYEHEVVEQMRRELVDILGYGPPEY